MSSFQLLSGRTCSHAAPHAPAARTTVPMQPAQRLTHRRQRTVQCQAATKAKGFGKSQPKSQPPPKGQAPVVDRCPCESGKSYKNCCQKIHEGTAQATTAEEALRARFTAYVRNQPQHIISTTHPEFYPYQYNGKTAEDDEAQMQFSADVEQGCNGFVYADFKVVRSDPGETPDEAFVAFSYKSAPAGVVVDDKVPENAWNMTDERCRFKQVDGKWLFVDYQEYTRNLTGILAQVEQQQQKKAQADTAAA